MTGDLGWITSDLVLSYTFDWRLCGGRGALYSQSVSHLVPDLRVEAEGADTVAVRGWVSFLQTPKWSFPFPLVPSPKAASAWEKTRAWEADLCLPVSGFAWDNSQKQ